MGRLAVLYAAPGAWAEQGECARRGADMSLHNVKKQDVRSPAAEARKTICRACPVIEECRAWAMTDPDPAFMHVAGGLHLMGARS